MNISLTPDLTRLIKDKIASGQYRSASEVVREALRRFADNDISREERLADLRSKIAVGRADSEAGRLKSGRAVMKRIHARLSRLEKARRTR